MSGLLPRALAFLSLSWQVDSSLWSTCGWGEINYMINWSLLHFIGFLLPWIFMKLSHGLGTRRGAGAGGTQPPAGTDGQYCPWCQNHQGVQTSERAPVVLTFRVDQSMSNCWSFFFAVFSLNSVLFFSHASHPASAHAYFLLQHSQIPYSYLVTKLRRSQLLFRKCTWYN